MTPHQVILSAAALAFLLGAGCVFWFRSGLAWWRRRQHKRAVLRCKDECDRWNQAIGRLHVWRKSGAVGLLIGMAVGQHCAKCPVRAFGVMLMSEGSQLWVPLVELRLAIAAERATWPEHLPQEERGTN